MKHISKKSRKVSIFLLFLTLILFLGTFNMNQYITSNNFPNVKTHDINYTIHASIIIDENSDFGTLNYNFPGTGSEIDPYRIEYLAIDTTDIAAISITGTTDYFVIQHCDLKAEFYAIWLENTAFATSTIFNNTCRGSHHGLISWNSPGISILNNTFKNNHGNGMMIDNSYDSIIANNTCSNNEYGTQIIYCQNSMVVNNSYFNDGLDIYEPNVDYLLTYTVYGNTVNGKPIEWFTNLNNTTIDDPIYGQIFLINCTKVTVKNHVMVDAIRTIVTHYCTNTTIFNNTCSYSSFNGAGVTAFNSPNSTIANNTCEMFEHGILVIGNSDNSVIENNTCKYNADGLSLSGISDSKASYNLLSRNMFGLSVSYATNTECSENKIYYNDYYGIWGHGADTCKLTYNRIKHNVEYGIKMESSSENNVIHHNEFINNSMMLSSQAYDDGTNNVWFDINTLEGNSWDDLGTSSTYSIAGSAGSIDLYPLNILPVPEFNNSMLISVIVTFGAVLVISRYSKKRKRTNL